MIYNSSLTLIKVIDNSPGSAAHWINPRGIAFDSAQNLYIVSQDSTGPAPLRTDIPGTGKLIRITDPLGGATKTVLLTGLNNPKAVAINSGNLYVSEYGGNKVTRYDLYTMSVIDFATITKPVDLFTTGCALYCSEQGTNTVRVKNAVDLTEPGVTITGFNANNSPSGIMLDDNYNLFVSDNDSNRVVFYNAIDSEYTGFSAPYYYCTFTYPSLKDSTPPYGIFHQWKSNDTLIVKVDSVGNILGLSPGTTTVTQITGTDTITYYVNAGACDYYVCWHNYSHVPSYFPPDSPIVINSWISYDTLVATIDTSGNVFGVNVGTTTVRHIINADTMTFPIIVLPSTGTPAGPIYMFTDTSTIYGSDTFCISSVIQLFDNLSGGIWGISAPIADIELDGSIWPTNAGSATVSYTIANGCYVNVQYFHIVIQEAPILSAISGSDTICRGQTTTLTNSTPGGTWSSSDTVNAPISLTGVVTGVAFDSATIRYTFSNYCGSASTTKFIHIDTATTNAITGADTVCKGVTITLSDPATGGVWSCSNTTDSLSNGVFKGNAVGIAVISYSLICSPTTTHMVTVNPAADAGTITGATSVCTGATITLSDTAAGGTWHATNSSATVAGGGVTGVSAGDDIIVYKVSNSCGIDSTTYSITVNSSPNAGTVTGPNEFCGSYSANYYTDGDIGGAWSAIGDATIDEYGELYPTYLPPSYYGSADVTYTVSNICGIAANTFYGIYIDPIPDAGAIVGPSEFCISDNPTYDDLSWWGNPGWSISDPTIASFGLWFGTPITLYPYHAGTATITFTTSNTCGSSSTDMVITIDSLPVAGTITGAGSVCVGDPVTLTDVATGGIWSSNNGNATVTGGTVTGVTAGTDTITYTTTNTCGSAVAMHSITINPLPNAGTITGATTVCAAATTTLTDAITGGTWHTTNGHATVASGVVIGVTAGIDTIIYKVTNSCGVDSAIHIITINSLPDAGTITGGGAVCGGSTTTLTDVITGGTWSATNGHATVSGGVAAGVTAGIDTVIYIVTNSCGNDSAIHYITVNPLPDAGAITGAGAVCAGAATTLTDAAASGTWHASNSNVTVAGGVVTGVSAGVDTIVYKVTNSCGSDSATFVITVNPLPNAGTVTGPYDFCVSSSATYSDDGDAGGTWSLAGYDYFGSPAYVATINSSGVVFPIANGSIDVTYTISNACGSISNIFPGVTIDAEGTSPVGGVSGGPSEFCVTGSAAFATDYNYTYIISWALDDPSLASLDFAPYGGDCTVYPVAAGSTTLTYTGYNTCGTFSSSIDITIDPDSAGTILGAIPLCPGTSDSLYTVVPGGTWSISNTHATIGGEIVTASTAGVDTVFYIIVNTCGTLTDSHTITINPAANAGSISGADTLCISTPAPLTSTVVGGIWGATNTNVYISGGLAYYEATGVDTILYTVSNTCGADTARFIMATSTYLNAGTISGPSEFCYSDNPSFIDDGDAGGTWSIADPSVAYVDPLSGTVYPYSSPFYNYTTLIYAVTNSCGTNYAYYNITIDPTPGAGVIYGSIGPLCAGSSDTVFCSSSIPGGTWSASNSAVTVTDLYPPTGDIMARLNGISSGVDIISYSVTNYCGTDITSQAITVNPLPVAGSITSTSATVCAGSSILLADTTAGGTWLSSNATASVTTGNVIGISAGIDTIIYKVTNTCGADSATYPITVITLPYPGIITGPATVCAGDSIILSEDVTGGAWSELNGSTSVSAATVYGISMGTDTVFYAVSNTCGTDSATYIITVNDVPDAGAITGPDSVCQGAVIVLTESAPGGIWSSVTANATVSSGTVHGISAGADTIYYMVSNVCGNNTTGLNIIINPLPAAETISGAASVCTGDSILLTDTATTGTWAVTNGSASITAGYVTGITSGTDSILYIVVNSCGADTATISVTVMAIPAAGALSGADSVCQGASTTLSDTVSGGSWTISNSSATISGGIVTGVSAGADTIRYVVTNACGSDSAVHTVSILPLPAAGTISGTDSICTGTSDTLSDSSAGGTWSVSNAAIATISMAGVITAISSGTDTVRYTTANVCGTNTAMQLVNINTIINAVSGTDTVCQGASVNLPDTTGATVTWSSSNPAIASISSSGIATCVAAGIDTITYTVTNYCGTSTATVTLYALSDSACNALSVSNTLVATQGKLKVYPSPNDGTFTIELISDISEDAAISVVDPLGKNVYECTTTTNKPTNIKLATASGMYFLYVDTPHYKYVTKVIVTDK